MKLDELKQKQLGELTAIGTAETEEQLKIRDLIRKQQLELETIHNIDPEVIISDQLVVQDLVKGFFEQNSIKRFGYSPIIPEYLYKNAHIDERETRAIVFAVPMNYERMQSAPSIESGTEIMRAYMEVGQVVVDLTGLLRTNGFQATAHHPLGDLDDYHHLLMPPLAVEAGLGEKGRTGLFIDHILGPMVRLGVVTTSAELPFGNPKIKGVSEFCKRCLYCVSRCPPRALPKTSYQEFYKFGTVIEFKIDGDRCIKYFEKHNACGRCVVHCVLAKETEEEIRKRMNRIENWYLKWIESGEMEKLIDSIASS